MNWMNELDGMDGTDGMDGVDGVDWILGLHEAWCGSLVRSICTHTRTYPVYICIRLS